MLYIILFFILLLIVMLVVVIWMHESLYKEIIIPPNPMEEKVNKIKYRIYTLQRQIQQNK